MISYSQSIIQGTLDEMIETKQHALDRVESNASEAWKQRVLQIIQHLCYRQSHFSLNDVKQEMMIHPEETPNKSAYGAMLRNACIKGFCEVTDTFVQSNEKKAHQRMIRVYKSKL